MSTIGPGYAGGMSELIAGADDKVLEGVLSDEIVGAVRLITFPEVTLETSIQRRGFCRAFVDLKNDSEIMRLPSECVRARWRNVR